MTISEKILEIKEKQIKTCALLRNETDEKMCAVYEQRLKALRDYQSQLCYYQEKIEEKIQEEIEKIAQKMKSVDMPIDQIAQATGLSIKQIEEL